MSEIENILKRIEKILCTQSLDSKNILSFKETCEYLDLSESYLYKLTSGRKIPHFSPNNKKLYFKKEELDQWLLRNKRESTNNLDSMAANYIMSNPLNEKQ